MNGISRPGTEEHAPEKEWISWSCCGVVTQFDLWHGRPRSRPGGTKMAVPQNRNQTESPPDVALAVA
jgi:hypothetical protein